MTNEDLIAEARALIVLIGKSPAMGQAPKTLAEKIDATLMALVDVAEAEIARRKNAEKVIANASWICDGDLTKEAVDRLVSYLKRARDNLTTYPEASA